MLDKRVAPDRLARSASSSCTREALELFRGAGQRVEDNTVLLDPDFVLEQVATAPRDVRRAGAQSRRSSIHLGGDHMASPASTARRSCARATCGATPSLRDFERFCQLAQSFAELDSAGGTIVRAQRRAARLAPPRHGFRLQTLTDKPYMGSVVSAERARDTLAHVRHRCSAAARRSSRRRSSSRWSTATRRCAGTTACSSRALEYHRANQPVVITPFLLMGAMSPVSIPATLAQQIAEALAGISLAQLITRPGCAGDPRLVPVQHRHAVRLAAVRHPGVGDRPALHGPDRSALRPAAGAPAAGSRRARRRTRRRPTRR